MSLLDLSIIKVTKLKFICVEIKWFKNLDGGVNFLLFVTHLLDYVRDISSYSGFFFLAS